MCLFYKGRKGHAWGYKGSGCGLRGLTVIWSGLTDTLEGDK